MAAPAVGLVGRLRRGTAAVGLVGRLRRGTAAVVLGALLAPVWLPSPTAALSGPAQAEVRPSFFGLHQSWLGAAPPRGWPQARVGAIRLWDNGVTWRDLERTPGVFDWTTLDRLVRQAQRRGASVLLVLGQTPRFHARNPAAPGFFGPGATSMPRRGAWTRYVQAVARRNQSTWGGRVSLQVWNEGNNEQYWTGTPRQLAQLTRWTAQAARVAPTRLIAPAMATRLSGDITTAARYYSQRPGGRALATYVDGVAFHLYPAMGGGPEAAMRQLREARAALGSRVAGEATFVTEISYGVSGEITPDRVGIAPPPLPTTRQVAFAMRTYVLAASRRIRAVYWYAWDRIDLANTLMVESDYITPTPAGRAFTTVQSWITGTTPKGCDRSLPGTWRCVFVTAREERVVVWRTGGTAAVLPLPGTQSYSTADGRVHAADGRSIAVGEVPIVLRRNR